MQLHRPFGDLGHEAAREFVRLVEVDIEKRDADAQRPDHLDMLVSGRSVIRLLALGRRVDRVALRGVRRRLVAPSLGIEQGHRPRCRGSRRRRQGFAAREVEQKIVNRIGTGIGAARREPLDQRRRFGRDAEVEVDDSARHVVELRIGQRRLHALFARVVEAVEHRRSTDVDDRQVDRRGGRVVEALEARQIEFEGHFGRRLHHLGIGWRPAAEFQIGSARQIVRQAEWQGDVGTGLAHLQAPRDAVGGHLDLALVAPRVAVGGDVVDPAREMAEHPGGKLNQRRLGGALIGKLGIEDLLASPGRFAEGLQADHARTALERVEGAPHRRQQAEVVRRIQELGGGRLRALDHLARFLEEDAAHLVVVLEIADQGDRLHRRERHRLAHRLEPHRLGRGSDEIDQRFGEFAARGRHLDRVVGGLDDRFLRLQHGRGQRRLVGCLCFVRQALEFARHLLQRHVVAHRAEGEHLRLFDQARLDRQRPRLGGPGGIGATHHRRQRAGLGVEYEQRLGELRLHAQHVDHEAERAQVAGEAIEDSSLGDSRRVDFGRSQTVHFVAHAQQGLRRLIHAEHREYATHRGELGRNVDEDAGIGRVAEEVVDRLFGDAERGAQLLDHAAHRLPVGDAPVQLFHPRLERLGRRPLADRGQPLTQAADAVGVIGIVEIAVLERRFDVEQAGRHFHGKRRRRCGVRGLRLRDRRLQFGGERFAVGEEPAQRIADQRELLGQARNAMHLAARRRRPRFLGGDDALLGVGDDGRIEAAEHAQRVVGRRLLGQAVGDTRGREARQAQAGCSRGSLGAKEEQVAGQPLGNIGIAALQDAELGQQARGDALGEDIEAEQAVVLRLEHRRGEVPEAAHLRVRRAGGETSAEIAHLRRGGERLGAAHELQQMAFELAANVGVGRARHDVRVGLDLAPAPVHGPEIGGVDALGLDRFLHCAVLREQRKRRHGLAAENAREEIEQRERRAFDVGDQLGRQRLRPGDASLHRRLARAQDDCRRRQADQLERADALVDLRARHAQHAGIDVVEVGAGDGFRILDEPAQRLVRRVERTAQLFLNPGDRAQVVAGRGRRIRGGGFVERAVHAAPRLS